MSVLYIYHISIYTSTCYDNYTCYYKRFDYLSFCTTWVHYVFSAHIEFTYHICTVAFCIQGVVTNAVCLNTKWSVSFFFMFLSIMTHRIDTTVFTPQPLRAPGYCRTPSGWAAGQTSPVNTLTFIIFHGSFSNLARTCITLRSRTSSIM